MGCLDLRSLEYGRGDFPPDRYGLDLKTRRLYGVYCPFGWWRFSLFKPPESCRYLDAPEKKCQKWFRNTCSWTCHYNTWVFHVLNTLHFTIFKEIYKETSGGKKPEKQHQWWWPLGVGAPGIRYMTNNEDIRYLQSLTLPPETWLYYLRVDMVQWFRKKMWKFVPQG